MSRSGPVDDETLRRELNTFGLSEKEIETYLAVLDRGEATASTIADHADVSKRYVYSIASQLADRGLVQMNDHASPTTVRARPPSEAIARMSERLQSLTPTLENRHAETEPLTARFQTVKSRQTALKYLRELISNAREEVFLCLPLSVHESVAQDLADAVDRDVLVIGLYSDAGPEPTPPSRFEGRASVVRTWTENTPFMLVADNYDAILGDADLLAGPHADDTAVVLSQVHLAGSVLGSFIGSFWPVASQRFVTEPEPLPRRFASFRHAVVQTVLHLRAGTDPVVEVETAAGEELSGRVVDVRQSLVAPETGDFPVENGIIVETGDGGTVSVGGPGAFVEDYTAETITVRRT
ncbi:TrmB family transcriptional regulator [Halomarina halobia]|uniref:TrmB family transcriptional regulator n=1 Tax=Halomarina halobia TaxID=3033386 RepID=A0ABD6AF89_9EURY|nr:TrmB family transcriptional regulator sugar-binding domain-containing protein [Halomarina sp. PSR21]